jgi:selenocysteine lyase/cysteine desulfurase
MNAGFGTGVMYISDDFLQEYTPAVAGFNSYTFTDGQPQYIAGARSFEPGHPNMYGYSVLDAAVQHKMQVGIEHIEEHNMALTQLLLDEIKEANVQLLGDYTINNRTSFVLLKEHNNLAAMLKDNGIVATSRMGLVRISFHYYNTKQDVAKVAELLKAV